MCATVKSDKQEQQNPVAVIRRPTGAKMKMPGCKNAKEKTCFPPRMWFSLSLENLDALSAFLKRAPSPNYEYGIFNTVF